MVMPSCVTKPLLAHHDGRAGARRPGRSMVGQGPNTDELGVAETPSSSAQLTGLEPIVTVAFLV
jgi:hypothetical protein